MGSLFLVRHAQASSLEKNYDKLSKLGEAQANLLGEYWASHKIIFDRACVGPCVRHLHTVKFARNAFSKQGLAFPEPLVMPQFDEYQAEAVLERSLPGLLESHGEIRQLHASFQSSSESTQQRSAFQKLFEAVIGEWVNGKICPQGVEAWPEFCARVNAGLSTILAVAGRGERIAIFTSGGPIAVAVQRALQLTPQTTLAISWMSRNSSWSEFLFDAKRFSLSSFNSHGHIDDRAMLTYR
jgi:broad specificity phosphatase PhoE